MEQFVLTEEIEKRVESSLKKFMTNSRARCALLITRSGQMISQFGFTTHLNTLTLSALVAGIFSTTQELARLLGESKFKSFFQEGKIWNIHFILVGEDLIFATLFDRNTVLGVIQISAMEVAEELSQAMSKVAMPVEIPVVPKPVEPDKDIEKMKEELAQLEKMVLSKEAWKETEKKEIEEKEEKPPKEGGKLGLGADFEESAAEALDKLFEV